MKTLLVVVIAVVFYLTFAAQTQEVQEQQNNEEIVKVQEQSLDARNYAQTIANNWGDWSRITDNSEMEFYLYITSAQVREEYDPTFSVSGNESRVRVASSVTRGDKANVSIEHIYKGNRLVKQLTLEYDNGWSISPVSWSCPSEYQSFCRSEYAKHIGDSSLCSGPFIFDCYAYFEEEPPLELALDACTAQTKQSHDQCLFSLTPSNASCNAMRLQQNRYQCLGLWSGSVGDVELCLDQITSRGADREANVAQCVIGYVIESKDNECERIELAGEKERCYDLLEP